ncbi:MAG TPA: response regulator [Candidatus Sulfotelmatobacter sp.]|nr:response regulator [Candidatus Sulfotelmatobacter sp.]
MKRVLFVDDEPAVLEDLKRMLDPQKEQWEMAFAPGGEGALSLLDAAPFEVVVSGVRMRGMDGAALMQAVCERHPSVVRIVMAKSSEFEGALRTISIAHQFLRKPCDPTMLRVAVERATSLSAILNNKLLASTVGSVKDLPVLPRTYLALRQELADPECAIKKIVRLVEQDVAISAKVLQLVNSALFGLPREISTVQTAVSFLGIEMLQSMVLSAGVFHLFEAADSVPGFSFEALYEHSQLVAKIAGRFSLPPYLHNIAIVAGLLHDVGKLLLATRSSRHFSRAVMGAREENRPLFDVEAELMGVSHAEIGAYLLGIWGLPSPVVEAVAHHHHPGRVPQQELDAVGAVHIANFLAHEHPVHRVPGAQPAYRAPQPDYLEALGMSDQMAHWGEMAEEMATAMRTPPVPAQARARR